MTAFAPETCPHCGVSWVAEEIPIDLRHQYGGRTHFRRSIGIYDLRLDMRTAVQCPDCGARFDRWNGKHIATTLPLSTKLH